MKEVSSERIHVDLENILQKHSKDEIGIICSEITRKISDKADELGQLFKSLHDAYPEIFGLVDFSLICTFTAAPFGLDDAPFLCMLGTQEGIAKGAQGIIAGLKEMSHD